MQIKGQWTYDSEGRKAIHEAGHVALALRLGIEIGDNPAVTVIGEVEGGGYTKVCDDSARSLDPKRIKQRAVVAMAGIASDVLYGRNHLSPSSDSSWEAIYSAEESWRPDIRKACCLD